jgi:2-phospho-L-lactate guanylyltransferase
VSAAAACPVVGAVIVVTDDEEAASVLGALHAVIAADEPAAGLNPALAHGAVVAAARWPASGVAALAADLPALRPDELDRGLRAAGQWAEAFVADAAGTGTTLYTARPGTAFRPRFGAGSAGRYRDGGAVEVMLADVPSLRSDVDTPDDLRQAASLGLGPRTAQLAAQLA